MDGAGLVVVVERGRQAMVDADADADAVEVDAWLVWGTPRQARDGRGDAVGLASCANARNRGSAVAAARRQRGSSARLALAG